MGQPKVRRLTLWQRIQLRLSGCCFLRWEKRLGWSDYLPIYLVRCKRHNIYFEDYPHGYEGYFLCPKCMEEWK
jgi:hypothetical protein